jgi:fatty acid synthase
VQRGARSLLLTSKRGLRTGAQARALRQLRSQGAVVEVSTLDVGDAGQAARVVAAAQAMAPLAGLFHLAMVLRDRRLPDQVCCAAMQRGDASGSTCTHMPMVYVQTGEEWQAVRSGKAQGAQNLDAACADIATLDHFVTFSSMVAHVGSDGVCVCVCRAQSGKGGAAS